MRSEAIETRIENYTARLPQAVQSSNGAQFSLLLSLIASNQELYRPGAAAEAGAGGFALPEPALSRYPDPNEFYTDELVGRLNQAVNAGLRGEYAYLVSQVDVQSQLPRRQRLAADSFAQVALEASGRIMLDTVDQSRRSIRTSA